MSHCKDHTAKIHKIPKERFWKKVRRSVIGLGAIALGFFLESKLPQLSDWLFYGLIGFGFFSISGDLVRAFLGYIPAAIREIGDAILVLRKALGLGGDA